MSEPSLPAAQAHRVPPAEYYTAIRPGVGRLIPLIAAALMFAGAVIAAVTLPAATPGHKGGWNIADRGMVVVFVGIISAFLLRYALIKVELTPESIRVRNLFLTRTIPWTDVVAVRYERGDPWASIDLIDDDTVALMAVQAADGPVSRDHAQRVATLAHVHGARR